MKKKNAFTLIELLVVISIIAVLMSIMMPALAQVRRQAKRSVCSANLRSWGTAVNAYSSDNNAKLLGSLRVSGRTGGIVPGAMLLVSPDTNPDQPWEGQMNMDAITPYLPGFDLDRKEMSPAWMCPDSAIDAGKLFNLWAGYMNAPVSQKIGIWFPISYAYYGRADLWGAYSTKPAELTGRTLSSNKLLMADNIYRWHTDKSWWFNHGTKNNSVHDIRFGKSVFIGEPKIEGANELYGDGAVVWKKGSQFDSKLMNECNEDIRQVFSIGNRPGTGNDTTFW